MNKHKPAFDELEKFRQVEKKKDDKDKEQKSAESIKSKKNDEMNLFEENETECVK